MRVRTPVPSPKSPVVDRLAFLLPCSLNSHDGRQSALVRIRSRVETEIENLTCERIVIKGSRYRLNFRIVLPSGTKVLVQIGAFDARRRKGDVRVEMNPARFADGDVEAFHEVMGRVIGRRYQEFLEKALLHRVDIAVDVVHADLSRMLVTYSNAQRFTMFGKRMNTKGHVEGYNFGSVTSDYTTAVYSKNIEQVHQAVRDIARKGLKEEPLTANMIKQIDKLRGAPPMMRVEVRGKRLMNLPLHELRGQTNRFERFSFASLGAPCADLPPWLETAFLSLCREIGVKAALTTLKKTEHACKVRRFWRTRQCSWWKPEQLWEQACDALEMLGVFPTSAFAPLLRAPVRHLSTIQIGGQPRERNRKPGDPIVFANPAPKRSAATITIPRVPQL